MMKMTEKEEYCLNNLILSYFYPELSESLKYDGCNPEKNSSKNETFIY